MIYPKRERYLFIDYKYEFIIYLWIKRLYNSILSNLPTDFMQHQAKPKKFVCGKLQDGSKILPKF